MPTFTLFAVPAVSTRDFISCSPLSRYRKTQIEAQGLAGIRAAVQSYGDRFRADYPSASFLVSISIERGQRKPSGFDAANRGGSLGTERWVNAVPEDMECSAYLDRIDDTLPDGERA